MKGHRLSCASAHGTEIAREDIPAFLIIGDTLIEPLDLELHRGKQIGTRVVDLDLRLDMSDAPPAIRARTLVLGCPDNSMVPAAHAKALTAEIAGAHYAELPPRSPRVNGAQYVGAFLSGQPM